MTGSSLIANGLTWWQAVVAIVVGNLLVMIFVVLNSLPGIYYHRESLVLFDREYAHMCSWIPGCQSICVGSVWKPVRSVESDTFVTWYVSAQNIHSKLTL